MPPGRGCWDNRTGNKKSVAVNGSVLISYLPDTPNWTRDLERPSEWLAPLRPVDSSGRGIGSLGEGPAVIQPHAHKGFAGKYGRFSSYGQS